MSAERYDHAPLVRGWLHESIDVSPVDTGRIARRVEETPQRRGFLSPPFTGRFGSMFSATKFVVAGAIVALLGGFLLSGVLTQQGEEPLPAVGASASVSASPASTTRSDILPGVDLEVEEFGLRLVRVLGDGERRTLGNIKDVAVAPNGDVWIMRPNGTVHRLGEPGAAFQTRDAEFHLREDDTLWVDDRRLEGETWVKDGHAFCQRDGFVLAPDGTCWHRWGPGGGPVARFDPSGQMLETGSERYPEVGFGFQFDLAPDGTVWTVLDSESYDFPGLAFHDGSSWTDIVFDQSDGFGRVKRASVAPDGVVWALTVAGDMRVVSWDGEAWATYGPMEIHDSWGRSGIDFLPDGSPWFGGIAELDGDTLRPIEVLAPLGDRTQVVTALTNGPDGSTWVVVSGGLYVITPEAVAASE